MYAKSIHNRNAVQNQSASPTAPTRLRAYLEPRAALITGQPGAPPVFVGTQQALTVPSDAQRSAPLPDARSLLPALRQQLSGKLPAIFLDYDGTLTPITQRPEEAVLSARGKAILAAVAQRCPVFVVSGRGRTDVQQHVGLDNITYAGSHGFDIGDGSGVALLEVGAHLRGLMPVLLQQLETYRAQATAPGDIGDTRFENKGMSLALHYRTAPKSESALLAWADALVRQHPQAIRAFHESGDNGKVIELKGTEDWHKGKAVAWLLERLASERGVDAEAIVPFFFGDARTDEDGFVAVRQRGYGVRVLDPCNMGPRHPDVVKNAQEVTCATLSLSTPDSVHDFLDALTAPPW